MKKKPTRLYAIFSLFAVFLLPELLFAQDPTLATIRDNISSSGTAIFEIVRGVSIVSGIAFFVASAFKLHRYKQNPQQVSIGQPISLLVIAVIFVSLPTTFSAMKNFIYGSPTPVTKLGDKRLENIVVPD